LHELVLPYLRFRVSIISLFLMARLLDGRTLKAAAAAAFQLTSPTREDNSGSAVSECRLLLCAGL